MTTSQYTRLKPGCVGTLQLKHSDTASPPRGALQLQAAAQAGSPTAGSHWAHSPVRGTYTTYHSVPCFLPASQALLCCCTAGKPHTNLSLGSSAGLTWGTAAKAVWNPTAILSVATALLSPLTSSICHRRPCSKKNRQRRDASRRMKWNCHSPQSHPKKPLGQNETFSPL